MPEQAPNYAELPFSLGGPSVAFPGVAQPNKGGDSQLTAVGQLKELTEILTRQRGRINDSAVLVSELKALWAAISVALRDLQVNIDSVVPGGGGSDTNAIHDNISAEISAITPKATIAVSDQFVIEDSAAGWGKKALSYVVIRNAIETYLDIAGEIAALDLVFLKLDASNDPITAPLEIQGAIKSTGVIENVTLVSSTYNVLATDDNIVCDTSGGAFPVILPASPDTGRVHTIILEVAGNDLTIDGNGNNIYGDTTATLDVAGDAIQVMFNGTQWNIK